MVRLLGLKDKSMREYRVGDIIKSYNFNNHNIYMVLAVMEGSLYIYCLNTYEKNSVYQTDGQGGCYWYILTP